MIYLEKYEVYPAELNNRWMDCILTFDSDTPHELQMWYNSLFRLNREGYKIQMDKGKLIVTCKLSVLSPQKHLSRLLKKITHRQLIIKKSLANFISALQQIEPILNQLTKKS